LRKLKLMLIELLSLSLIGLKDISAEDKLFTSSDNSTKLSSHSKREMISSPTMLSLKTLFLSVLETRCACKTLVWVPVELLVLICPEWEEEAPWVVMTVTPCLLPIFRE
jgi:hypothetical protein